MHPAIQQCPQCHRAIPVERQHCSCGHHLPNKRLQPTRVHEGIALQRLLDGTAWQQCTVGEHLQHSATTLHHHATACHLQIDLYTNPSATQLIINCDITGRQYINATMQLPTAQCIAVANSIASVLLSKTKPHAHNAHHTS